MIIPNTLQIGNLIQHHDNPEPFVLNAYGILNVSLHPENYSPLPITPDRLREAGFVEYPTGRFRLDHFVIDDRDHIYIGSTPLVRKGAWHDIQNLVRLISGKDI